MSALTDRIAAEHQPESGEWSVCICGQADLRYGRAWDRHIADVTEAAVREQVAQTFDALARDAHDHLAMDKRRTRAESFDGSAALAWETAAHIARGAK